MARIASLLSPEDIAAVTVWLAAQPAPAGAVPRAAGTVKLPLECGSVPQ
jgi:cytochrome c553